MRRSGRERQGDGSDEPFVAKRRPPSIVRLRALLGIALVLGAVLGAGPSPGASRAGTPAADAPSPGTRTNVIVFLADDLGYSDLGCYGSEIRTPNLDALAESGLRFTDFYNTGRCSPSRAALLTGFYPHQVGLNGVINDENLDGGTRALSPDVPTLAEVLREAGYRTAMVGKWHLGHERPFWPRDRGFERFYGSPRAGGFYFRPPGDSLIVLDDDEVTLAEDWYATEAFTEHAVSFLQEADDLRRPFFLYFAFMAPHTPLQAPPELVEPYRGRYLPGFEPVRRERFGRMVRMSLASPRWRLLPAREIHEFWSGLDESGRAEVDERMAIYAAQVEAMDIAVGRVLEAVRDLGREEDTLVLFLSDNGASSRGGLAGFTRGVGGAEIGSPESFASYGLGWARVSNTPLHGFKKWMAEGGIATPCIVRWPAGLDRPGDLERQPAHIIDVLPTCLAATGVGYPAEFRGRPTSPLEGRNLLPAFRGEDVPRDGIFWEHVGNRAVRRGPWKLVAHRGEDWRLYDLRVDRTETFDMSGVHRERVEELSLAYEEWARRVGVQEAED